MPKSCRQVDTALSGLNQMKEALVLCMSSWPEENTDHKAACWYVLAPAQKHLHIVAPCTQWRRCSETKTPASPCLIDLTSLSFLKTVRRMLTLLGHTEANKCTLKAFRAGRATSLAAAGSPIGIILALHSSGTARPMLSLFLPSLTWSALKTRTEWHRREK